MMMTVARGLGRLGIGLAVTATLCAGSPPPVLPGSGWGIDASLATHVEQSELAAYTGLLKRSEVHWVGERGVTGWAQDRKYKWDRVPVFRALGESGLKVIAYAQLPDSPKPRDAANSLPEDLLLVYDQGRRLQREFGSLVAAWQMVTEADLGYCTDLPDRVAAYQKALYLGLKAGGKAQLGDRSSGLNGGDAPKMERPSPNGTIGVQIVLMGALGMPPGPWLERAAVNGLLDYTEAYNFHFYGHAAHLTGVIEAHRSAARQLGVRGYELDGTNTPNSEPLTPNARQPSLPLWITEAGLEAVSKDDFLNPQRRQLQADFTISTAQQALAAEDVAVFMPFILVHDKDPYAMTLSPWETFPAWEAYAKFTRENPWPNRPLAREPHEVNPVIVQWLPDNQTTVPRKVSGTYRFKEGQTIRGELRIYNFGDHAMTGRIEAVQLKNAVAMLGAKGEERRAEDGRQISEGRRQTSDLRIPAMGMVSLPLEFTATAHGYFRETWSAAFVEVGAKGETLSGKGRVSRVSFGLEAWAKIEDFNEEPLALHPLPAGDLRFPQIEPYAAGEQVGVWTTMNGLRAALPREAPLEVRSYALRGPSTHNNERLPPNADRPTTLTAWVDTVVSDPLAPTMAVSAVNGLPSTGFLRLQLDKPMTKERKVLVVLVDDRGQRYTIWENFGADYYGSRSDIWLNLEDFNADFWGPMSADYSFRPERIREIHLRLYLNTPNDKVEVSLSLLKARSMEQGARSKAQ